MTRRRSNSLFLPMVVIGGIMGLLAGYGALTIIRENRPPATTPPVPPPQPVRATPAPAPRVIPPPPKRTKPSPIVIEDEPEPFIIKKLPSDIPPDDVMPPEPEPLPPASAQIVLNFDKPIIRVIATTELKDVLCDIAVNGQLIKNVTMADPEKLHILFTLKLRDKKIHELPLQIDGAGAALEFSIVPRSKAIICEIRPQLSLPANGVEELTVANGTKLHNKLTAYLANIETFTVEKPVIKKELAQRRSEVTNAQSALRSGNLNPTGVNAANGFITKANRAIGILQKRLDDGDALTNDKSAIESELAKLNQIEQYAKSIAGVAQVYVRFHKDGATLAAEVR